MFISIANAADNAFTAAAEAPESWEVVAWNMGLVLVIVILFYVLMVMPQQRRFKEHKNLLDSLKKGDSVITGGGLIGKVHEVLGNDEIVVDLGGDVKVRALRSTIQTHVNNPLLLNDKKEDKVAKSSAKEDKEANKNRKK